MKGSPTPGTRWMFTWIASLLNVGSTVLSKKYDVCFTTRTRGCERFSQCGGASSPCRTMMSPLNHGAYLSSDRSEYRSSPLSRSLAVAV